MLRALFDVFLPFFLFFLDPGSMSRWGCGGRCHLRVYRYIAHTFFLGLVLGSMSRWACGGLYHLRVYCAHIFFDLVLGSICLSGVVVGAVIHAYTCILHTHFFWSCFG